MTFSCFAGRDGEEENQGRGSTLIRGCYNPIAHVISVPKTEKNKKEKSSQSLAQLDSTPILSPPFFATIDRAERDQHRAKTSFRSKNCSKRSDEDGTMQLRS